MVFGMCFNCERGQNRTAQMRISGGLCNTCLNMLVDMMLENHAYHGQSPTWTPGQLDDGNRGQQCSGRAGSQVGLQTLGGRLASGVCGNQRPSAMRTPDAF